MKCGYKYHSKNNEINPCEIGTTEDIELFDSINLKMGKLNSNTSFSIQDLEVNNGIKYLINTKYPDTLPDELVSMFFNLDLDFKVNCIELPVDKNPFIRSYEISVKKY